eukprot:5304024-Karenia_brevis.AAC.1
MASLQAVHGVPPSPKYYCMPSYRRQMTVKSLRHWPEEILPCMQQHCALLLMTSAASARAVRH